MLGQTDDDEREAESCGATAGEDPASDSGILEESLVSSKSSPESAKDEGKAEDSQEDDEEDALSRALQKMLLSRPRPKVDPNAVEKIAASIRNGSVKKIVVLAGAGISTAAGIPDFRTPGSGLYDNLKKFNLPYPQAVFEIKYFKKNPKPFFALAKELYPGSFKPTTSHYFVKLLQDKKILGRHYTQNIDDLEKIAGVTEEHLVQAHGTFSTARCLGCKKEYDVEWVKKRVFRDEVPKCEKCKKIVKPDIVFFGEQLPDKFYDLMQVDFVDPDLLIVMGTSLAVSPVNMLVAQVPTKCHKLLINREMVGDDLFVVRPPSDDDKEVGAFGTLLGDCDSGCQKLADLIGWGDELKDLVKNGHAEVSGKSEVAKSEEVAVVKKEEE